MIILVILMFIAVFIIFSAIDYWRVKSNKMPIFVIPVIRYRDGGSVEYYGLGYKVLKCRTLGGDNSIKIGFYNMKYSCDTKSLLLLNN